MAEIIVASTADSGAGSLRQAIADASDGDVILFDRDVFPQGQTTTILLSSYITVYKSISIYGGFSDGNGGYTSGATKRFCVYRDVEGVKTKVYIDENNPAQEGETVLFENVCRVALDGQEAVRGIYERGSANCVFSGVAFVNGNGNGGGLYVYETATATVNDCAFNACTGANGGAMYTASNASATVNDCSFVSCSGTSGGALQSSGSTRNTLNGCTFDGCSASSSGGGLYSYGTSQNTLNECTITNCSASSNGGGIYSTNTSQNTLNDCTISGNSATNGGGVYSTSESVITLSACTVTDNTATQEAPKRNDVVIGSSEINNISASMVGFLFFGHTTKPAITNGITKANVLTCLTQSGNTATITIADGAALTLTGSATIGAATFTSDGRGYLAVAAGINVSAATFENVVLCAYGADVSSFAEVDGVLEWEAANPTTTVLIERADGDSWSTVTQTAGESLTLYLPPSDTVRLFDGVQFFSAQAPAVRTYYYIGGSEGSFTSAADWSLRRGGVAITEPPVVAGQRFIVGDIEDAQEE